MDLSDPASLQSPITNFPSSQRYLDPKINGFYGKTSLNTMTRETLALSGVKVDTWIQACVKALRMKRQEFCLKNSLSVFKSQPLDG